MWKQGVYTGTEEESLRISLQRHRDAVLWKTEGLDDEQLRRPMTPTGTNLLGLVQHLAGSEYQWFCEVFGRPAEPIAYFDPDDPGDPAAMRVAATQTTADVLAYYARARAAADSAIGELAMEDTGTAWWGDTVSMRWVLIHMIEDTSRHAGHMDILRELIDGQTGDRPRN
jgi:uncharacterized damage-inducible protein DinB